MSASSVEPISAEQHRLFPTFARLRHVLSLATFALFLVPVWMFFHPYAGLIHDSILYSLCALARLEPGLGSDVFLKYGSQDQFTIFGALYADAIQRLGIESAAATLTFVSHVAFFIAAYHLSRRYMSANLALLSVGLLVVIPSEYGAYYIFKVTEDFLTPRLPAEAFTLAAIACALAGRKIWASIFFVAAAALHPIMAAAGAGMWFAFFVAIPKTRLASAIVACGLLAFFSLVFFMPIGPIARFDNEWLRIVQITSPFSFTHLWWFDHWARAILPLGALTAIAVFSQNNELRRVGLAALITGIAGLGLTALGSDLLEVVLITQMQPWRWLWLTNVLAILLIPVFAIECWKSGNMMRTGLVLLLLAWMFRGTNPTLSVATLALSLFAFVMRHRLSQPRHQSWIFTGASIAFALVLALSAIENVSLAGADDLIQGSFPTLRVWARNAIWPALVVLLAWWLGQRARLVVGLSSVALMTLIATTALFPSTWKSWTKRSYEQLHESYTGIRQAIPAGAEVFWAQEPLTVWYVLERPSYYSIAQAAGVVFARATALEVDRRAQRVAQLLSTGAFLGSETPDKLAALCASHDAPYFISTAELPAPVLASAVFNPGLPKVRARLYSCSSFRRQS